jgi:hypothetical protein
MIVVRDSNDPVKLHCMLKQVSEITRSNLRYAAYLVNNLLSNVRSACTEIADMCTCDNFFESVLCVWIIIVFQISLEVTWHQVS